MIFLHMLTFLVEVQKVCLHVHVACMIPSLITKKFVTWDIDDGWITITSFVKMI